MKPDIYTKVVLTVIAVVLIVIAGNQYISPRVTARAAGQFSSVQATGTRGSVFFDSNTGEIWVY
jgi:hypothetical protein